MSRKPIPQAGDAVKQAALEWALAKFAITRLQSQLAHSRAPEKRRDEIIAAQDALYDRARAPARVVCDAMATRDKWEETFSSRKIQIALAVSANLPEGKRRSMSHKQAMDPDKGMWRVRNARMALEHEKELCRDIAADPLMRSLIRRHISQTKAELQ